MNKLIILFDGVCNLCNSSINYIIDNDVEEKFQLASLQSEAGQQLLKKYQIPNDLKSIVLIHNDKYETQADAILEIGKHLNKISITYHIIKHLIPKILQNCAYNLIANNRYRLFGKSNQCRVPTPELQSRFLP